jgi:hypothetical protein
MRARALALAFSTALLAVAAGCTAILEDDHSPSTSPDTASSCTLASDSFARTVANGFGTADLGGAWRVSDPSKTKVANGHGVIYGFTAANWDASAALGTARGDLDVVALVSLDASNPTGSSYIARVVARAQTDARNGYLANLRHRSSGEVDWQLIRQANAGGTNTVTLASGTLLASGGAGTSWWIRVHVQGTSIAARYWRNGSAEPTTWTAHATDSYWSSGDASVGVFVPSGATAPFPQATFDNFVVLDLANGCGSGTGSTGPVISAIAASGITTSGATVTWTTDEAADSQVEYGTSAAYGNATTLATALVTNHSETLSGLSTNTLYHYRVKSRDSAGNLATSGDATFTTSGASCPSGQCLPVGDIPGWHQIFTDDFTTNVPSGAGVANGGDAMYFPQAVSSKWSAYPWPWAGTPTWANYFPERTTSIQNGMMDIWMHSEVISGTTRYLIDAVEPKVNGPSNATYLPAGRYVIRFKTDYFHHYHASFLLWPQWADNGTQSWPGSGEIDFPESDFDGHVYGFMHYQNGTTGGDQAAFSSTVPIYGAWHTAVIEWKSGTSCTFILDGQTIGTTTTRVPQSPMRWVIQNGGSFGGQAVPSDGGHVYVDWVAVYVPG